jgi:hypothetical protein
MVVVNLASLTFEAAVDDVQEAYRISNFESFAFRARMLLLDSSSSLTA